MDPGFFADPDPGFKSPDPSIYKFKVLEEPDKERQCLRVLDMKYNIFFYFYPSFRMFFSRIRIRIFPDRIREKKTRSLNTSYSYPF